MDECARKILNGFINEELQGNINSLADYVFIQLKGNKIYGCPGRSFDCDDTNLARAVIVLTWEDYFPNLSMETIGTGRIYRGDTMNSFHTMFGRKISDNPICFESMNYYAFESETIANIQNFYKKYHMIGNFTILPNKKADGTTFNCYRGGRKFGDFFDQFLIELDKCFRNTEDQDTVFNDLYSANIEALGKDSSVEKLANICFWNDYLDEQGKPKILFLKTSYRKGREFDTEYFKAVENYIAITDAIIQKRARRIIEVLKKKL